MGFTIAKLAWLTQSGARSRDEAVRQLRTIARFLDENGLAPRKLLDPPDRELGDDFAITSDDLTEEGLLFMKGGYQKWLAAVDRGRPPDDDTLLKRHLAKQREAGQAAAPAPAERPPARTKKAKARAPSADDPQVYDKARWHSEGNWPAGLPKSQAFVHTGLFLGWAIDRGLTSAEFQADFPELVEAFRARRKTGPEVYRLAGGVLASEMLDDAGNAFAREYLDLECGAFLAEYADLLAGDLPSAYQVEDSWPNHEKLRAHLDARFDAWKRSREGGGP